nr:MAG TPA: hypothetical protein [Bacteriophage sp.]
MLYLLKYFVNSSFLNTAISLRYHLINPQRFHHIHNSMMYYTIWKIR